MRKHLPFLIAFLLFSVELNSQTVFWSDNFDTPAGGANNNNAGVGWSASTNTPGGGQNTSFLGFSNSWIIGSAGACSSGNKVYIKSIGNGNAYVSDVFTDKLIASPSISTVGQSGLSLSFSWRCDGVANLDYGQVGLSTDNGTTWNWLPQQYSGQETCILANIALPSQYEGITTFKFAFRFISNATSCSTCDPPFNIDNIQLSGNSSGCTPPTVNAGANVSICAGAPGIAIGGSPTATGGSEAGAFVYSWTPTTGLNDPIAANPIASPAITTVYTVSVHRGTPACSATSQVTVTVNTPQTLTITPVGSTSICQGSSVTLNATAGFTNYSWTTPTGNQTGASVNASTAGAYSVTATGSNGCSSSSSAVNITVNTPQALTITPAGSTSICQGGSVTLNATAGFTNYSWTTPTGNLSGASVNASTAGAYSVTATGSNSCSSSSSAVNITVNTPQALTITPAGSTTICQGSSVTLNATAGFTNYSWTTPTGNQSGASVNASTAGAYSVTATGSNGCSSSSSAVNITVNTPQALTITPAGSTTICQGNSVTLNASVGFTNYSWTTPTGNQSGASVNASTAGAYSVTATGSNGCSSSSSVVNILVNTPQTLSTNPSGTISTCLLNPISITAIPGFTGYSWSTPSGIQSGTSVNASSTGSYTVSAFDVNGCLSSSNPVTLNVFAPIDLAINPSGNLDICEGSQVTLTASPGFTGLLWSTPTVVIPGNSINASQAGIYSVSGVDINGCTATSGNTNVSVNEPQELTTSPAGVVNVCDGESLSISASMGFTNYVWTTPGGSSSGSSISATAEGDYSVTAIDNNSCTSISEIVTVSIQSTVSLPITPSGPLSFCEGESITLTAAAGFTNYSWNGNPGSSTLEVVASGDYTATAVSASGCPAISEVISVTENQPQVLSISPSGNAIICSGQSIDLSASGGFSNYNWISPSGNLTGSSLSASTEGEYSVSATDINGCEAQSTPVSVSVVNPIPMVTFPEGTAALCPGTSLTLSAATIFTDYVWTSATFTGTGQVIEVDMPGIYSVSAIDENGCTTTSQPIDVQLATPPSLNVSPAGPIFRCPSLSITLTASQGFTDYLWTPGNVEGNSYTAIDAGSYTVSAISPQGCLVTSNTVQFNFFPDPPFIPVTPAGPLTLCPGENVVLTAGSGFTQYLWNTNNTGLTLNVQTAGNYVVTANDSNGCAANSQSIPVSFDALTPIQVNPSGDVFICEGESIELIAEAGFTNYAWNNQSNETSITVNEQGAYSVSAINDNGCDVASEPINVSFQELPTAQFEYLQQNGYNVDFENTSQNATSFFWEFNNADTSEEENPSYDFLFDNMWPVSLIACNDCGCDTLNTLVDVVKTGISNASAHEFIIVQNGSILQISSIKILDGQILFSLINLEGKRIIEHTSKNQKSEIISLEGIASGIYILQIQTYTENITRKILIN